jgi:ribosome biogenesis GTPase
MKGIVYKSTGSWYTVKAENGQFYTCKLKGKFRIKGIKSTNPVAVGDHVFFTVETIGDETLGIIYEIEDRKNYIIRKSVNLSKQTHIIASNIDLAFLLVTINNPATSTAFIDRFLVTSEAYHIQAVLLFNKIDACTQEELEEVSYLKALYTSIGYTCVEVSAKTGYNIETVKNLMQHKVSVFSGHSGVGKSTLINALESSLSIKTKAISTQHQQGQHTTTHAQMYDLSFGAKIIDTPGIRGFGMVEMEKEEVSHYFPEFFKLQSHCKFHNCLHVNEPQCAIKEALEQNKIAWSRYQSYLQIIEGENENYRKDIYAPK